MERAIEFKGTFEAAPLTALIPGGWYIGVACAACGRHFAILNEPSNTGEIIVSGDAQFEAACPACGETRIYRASDLAPFQSAQGGPVSTAG